MASSPSIDAGFLTASSLALDPETAAALAREMRTTRLRRSQFLFHQGDPSTRFHIVASGILSAHVTSADGRDHVLADLRPGATIGEASIVTGAPRSASVRAATAAVVGSVSRTRFLELGIAHPRLLLALATVTERTLRRLTEHTGGRSFHTTEMRLAGELVRRMEEAGEPAVDGIVVRATQQHLADTLGLTRETINRHLAHLTSSAVVLCRRGRVTVLDPPGLRARAAHPM